MYMCHLTSLIVTASLFTYIVVLGSGVQLIATIIVHVICDGSEYNIYRDRYVDHTT